MSSFSEFIRETICPSHTTCFVCASEAYVGEDDLCDACRNRLKLCILPPAPQPLDGLSAGLIYTEELHDAMHRFKYRYHLELASFFAQYMTIPSDWQVDIICPVPLHYLKELFRMYNQSEMLARKISAIYQIPYCRDLLRRTKYTGTQTKLSVKQRKKNVKNVFEAAPQAKGLSILLIDDICTTGATLVSCAEALKKRGAEKVYALCACKTGC